MKIHFIGIGGIGMSALAQWYLAKGDQVFGSDLFASPIIDFLKKQGAKIFLGPHQEKNLKSDIDLVVYSVAVPKDNPELTEARQRGARCQTYSQTLGDLTKKMFTIAVSGMHGKSTTTAMLGLILEAAGFDPTVIVGTKVKEWGSGNNFRSGKSKYLVIEADEYTASFLDYWPQIILLTNIEEEHLDFYKDLPDIARTFRKYISHLPKNGVLVANKDDKNVRKIAQSAKCKVQNYSVKFKIDNLNLRIPGKHNLSNAAAAIAAARLLGISDTISVKTLNNFSGTWRRMEYKGEINGAKIYDDYAHHPTEIKATLQAVREILKNPPSPPFPKGGDGGQLWCVFQPHQYQRTYKLFDKFVNAFNAADKIVLLPIYSVAGREKEKIKRKVNSQKLAEAIKKKGQEVIFLENFSQASQYLKNNLKKGDICVIMGAGDIYQLTEKVIHS